MKKVLVVDDAIFMRDHLRSFAWKPVLKWLESKKRRRSR